MAIAPLPEQFAINEAWIAFKLNVSPIVTSQDGDFNCIALMDAASGYILSMSLVSMLGAPFSGDAVAELMRDAHAKQKEWPKMLLIPGEQVADAMIEEAQKFGISVRRVPESRLDVFVSEARVGFNKQFGGAGLH